MWSHCRGSIVSGAGWKPRVSTLPPSVIVPPGLEGTAMMRGAVIGGGGKGIDGVVSLLAFNSNKLSGL